MILIVLLVLALFVTQTLIPGRFREAGGPGTPSTLLESAGTRDHQRPLTVVGQRAARALANLHEAMPVFLALALMNLIAGTAATLAVSGATVFLIARVVYVPMYMAGIPAVRSLVWSISWVGLAMMVAPLLDRI